MIGIVNLMGIQLYSNYKELVKLFLSDLLRVLRLMLKMLFWSLLMIYYKFLVRDIDLRVVVM